MDENNRNFILAIVLSIGVLFAWQYFFAPKPHPGQGTQQAEQQQQSRAGPAATPRGRGFFRWRRRAAAGRPGRNHA